MHEKWVVVFPSEGYIKLNDNSFRIVDDGETLFYSFIRNAGILEQLEVKIDEERGGREDVLNKLLHKVQEVLRPRLGYDSSNYGLYHCPFHPPDRNPSLYLNKRKKYVFDFHDGKAYSLKGFLEALGEQVSVENFDGEEKQVFKAWPLHEALAKEGRTEFIVENLIPLGSLILLYGYPGCGKSFLSLDLAIKVSCGLDVFGYFKSRKTNVLLIDLENSLSLLKERLEFLEAMPENVFLIFDGSFNILNQKNLNLLRKIIKEQAIGLTIIDNLTSVLPKQNENDSITIYRILSNLRRICLEENTTIILIHHARKTQMFQSFNPLDEIRGSSTIAAVSDLVFNLMKVQSFYQLRVLKNRIQNNYQTFLLELDRGGFKYLQNLEENFDQNISQICRMIEEIARSSPNGVFSVSEIYEACPHRRSEIYRALHLLQGVGKVRKIKRGVYQLLSQMVLDSVEGAE